MPQLQLVVLAVQDRLAYGRRFDVALASLLSENAAATGQGEMAGVTANQPGVEARPPGAAGTPQPGSPPSSEKELIDQAARDFADYQRLTAEGKLSEAGQKLESLKKALEQLRPPQPPPKR